MGSKNRIYLGVVAALILHHIRNRYTKEVYMSKRVYLKLEEKHPDIIHYATRTNFTHILEATVAVVAYSKDTQTYNFIAHIDDTYILYALKQEKNHTNCTTMFKLNRSTLKKYYNNATFKVIKKKYLEEIREYIN